MKKRAGLEKIIYFQDYVVVDPAPTRSKAAAKRIQRTPHRIRDAFEVGHGHSDGKLLEKLNSLIFAGPSRNGSTKKPRARRRPPTTTKIVERLKTSRPFTTRRTNAIGWSRCIRRPHNLHRYIYFSTAVRLRHRATRTSLSRRIINRNNRLRARRLEHRRDSCNERRILQR